jgi:uncharacterized membrane protein
MLEEVGKIIIMALGFGGFLLANYILDTKKTSKPLVCPLEGSCETVLQSEYSKILGIPVEILGVLYYGFITLFYFLLSFFPSVLPEQLYLIVVALTACAFLFSIYLTVVQSILIKHWCTWCLVSAFICSIIFILAIYIANTEIIELLRFA